MKKIIVRLLLVIGFVGNIFASNAIESSTKKPKRSEVLYQGIVPYFFMIILMIVLKKRLCR